MELPTKKAKITLIICLLVVLTTPLLVANDTNLAIGDEHTTDTDFQNGSTTSGLDIQGTGEDAVISYESDANESYVSANYSVTEPEEARVNLEDVAYMDVDVEWEKWDGNSWISVASDSYSQDSLIEEDVTLTGDLSNEDAEKYRVKVDLEAITSSGSNANLTSDAVYFTNTAPRVDNNTASPNGDDFETEDIQFEIDIEDDDFGSVQGDEVEADFYVNDTLVDSTTATSNGTITGSATVPDGSHTWHVELSDDYGGTAESDSFDFTIEHNDPELSDAAPSGDLEKEPSELSVNISDEDFSIDGDTVTLTFSVDGSEVDSQTVTGNQTVTASIPSSGKTGGSHDWSVTATDDYGKSDSLQETYKVPDSLEVRNETDTDELVDSPTSVTVQFIGNNEIFEKTSDSGTIDMTDLPVDQEFIVNVDASDGYRSRTIYIESIYQQQTVYLLPKNESTVSDRFVLNDPTGEFPPSDTTLYISKAINDSSSVTYEVIASDQFGTEGLTAELEKGQRYRLKIEAPDGTTQDMGPYRAEGSETVELRPSGPAVEFEDYEEGWNADAQLDNDTLTARYHDPENATDELTIYIHERGNESNQLRANETYYDLGDLSTQYKLTENESNKEWVVNFIAERDGETIEREVIVSKRGNTVPPELDPRWKHIIGIGLLILSAGSFSLLNRGVGAVMIAIEGALLWWMGWLGGATAGAAVVLYLFIAIMYNVYMGSRP